MNDIVDLDARRLLCPMPVIRLQNCLENQSAGICVRVTCTDPGTLNDIPTWCRLNRHEVLQIDEFDHEYVFLVQKAADGS